MRNFFKYLCALAISALYLADAFIASGQGWSSAWTNTAVRGQCEYWDGSNMVTGSVRQARIMDAHQAAKERGHAIGRTTGIPEAKWWRAERYDVIAHKQFIRHYLLDGYIDERSIGVDGTLNTFFSTNSVDWLSPPNTARPDGLYWQYENGIEFLEHIGLSTNFFDSTPWRSLHSATNGWPGIKICYENLHIVGVEGGEDGTSTFDGTQEYGYIYWKTQPAGTENYWYGEATRQTDWPTAKAAAEADYTGTPNSIESPRNWTGGTELAWGEYNAFVNTSYQEFDAIIAINHMIGSSTNYQLRTNYNFRADLYTLFGAPGGGSVEYDDYGQGMNEWELCRLNSKNYTTGDEHLFFLIGPTNKIDYVWVEEPVSYKEVKGWRLITPEVGGIYAWFLLDFAVPNGFKYITIEE